MKLNDFLGQYSTQLKPITANICPYTFWVCCQDHYVIHGSYTEGMAAVLKICVKWTKPNHYKCLEVLPLLHVKRQFFVQKYMLAWLWHMGRCLWYLKEIRKAAQCKTPICFLESYIADALKESSHACAGFRQHWGRVPCYLKETKEYRIQGCADVPSKKTCNTRYYTRWVSCKTCIKRSFFRTVGIGRKRHSK